MDRARHWEQVYEKKPADQVSWYAPTLARSLQSIRGLTRPEAAAVIDVGAGASTLVDDLLRAGYRDVTALDVSASALAAARARLGSEAERVRWIVSDVTSADLGPARFDLWHDRAVFHFLTATADRAAYAAAARLAIKPGGHLVMATFALDGPSRCSGLDVVRYDGRSLARELTGFELVDESRDAHVTPSGVAQRFTHAVLRRAS